CMGEPEDKVSEFKSRAGTHILQAEFVRADTAVDSSSDQDFVRRPAGASLEGGNMPVDYRVIVKQDGNPAGSFGSGARFGAKTGKYEVSVEHRPDQPAGTLPATITSRRGKNQGLKAVGDHWEIELFPFDQVVVSIDTPLAPAGTIVLPSLPNTVSGERAK